MATEIFLLLASQAGIMAYHLVLIFAILAVLMAVFGHWRERQEPVAGRALVGLLLLLATRLLLTILAGVALTGLFSVDLILPPTDRVMSAIGIILIVWMWGFPNFTRGGDIATILSLMLTATLGVLSLIIWSQATEVPFNTHWLGWGWEVYSSVLLVFGGILLLIRRPHLWGIGMGMLLVLLAGHVGEFFLADPTAAYPTLVRFAELVAYPLLFLLTYRMFTREIETPHEDEVAISEELPLPAVAPPPERVPIDPALFGDLFTLATNHTEEMYPALVRAVARAFQGDICFLVLPPTPTGEMVIRAGYNYVRKETLVQGSLKANEVPRLASAIRQGQTLRLLFQNTTVDLLNLGNAFNTARTGSLIAASLTLPDTQAGLVLYTPYSEYIWKETEEIALARAAASISQLIQGGHQHDATSEMADQLQVELSMTLAEREQLLREKEMLAKELTALRKAHAADTAASAQHGLIAQEELNKRIANLETEKSTLAQSIAELTTQQQATVLERDQFQTLNKQLNIELAELRALQPLTHSPNGQELLGQLEEENERLRQNLNLLDAQLRAASVDMAVPATHLEAELQDSLKENARLQKMVGEYEVKIFQMERQIQAAKASDQWDTIVTIAQEMRQPMSSVVGYSDFLLSESVGILGALQRKFLERVKASTERMISMIEELVQIASVEAGHTKLTVGSFDLVRALDTAISDTSPALREKNISLRMNIPDKLPKIQGDYEAVKLILTNLLQNAGIVSPLEGEITISVGYESYGDSQDYVLAQITDSGGGIPAEDLQRVFGEPSERAGKTGAIRGLGGSPLSLAFTKSLVEAHGGRIWVDAEFEKGSTFSILFPLSNEIPATVLANWRS
ncbi:MAG: hypothetical protein H6636_07600 [Anaerolineales bacterium]|nr:hypothetical protein [Anaerolineales bacterium]